MNHEHIKNKFNNVNRLTRLVGTVFNADEVVKAINSSDVTVTKLVNQTYNYMLQADNVRYYVKVIDDVIVEVYYIDDVTE